MKLSLILEATDKVSRPLDRSRKALGGLGRSAKEASGGLAQVDRRMNATERSAGGLERAARRMGAGLADSARRGAAALGRLSSRMKLSQQQMERLAHSAGSMIGSTLRGGIIGGGLVVAGGLTASLYKIVTAGIMFEKYRTQLTGLEGSVAGGNKAMDWVSNFAAKTPYEIGQVMDAFIALKAYGIDPTDGSLRTLGDAAAGMGKDLMQAVEMMADAQTGEFERLKEFGIKASVAGDKVTFRFQRNGKEMSRTIHNSATEIKKTLTGIFDERFAGGMDRLSKTTEGKWSNLMDSITRSAARVWEGGLGASINTQFDRLNNWISGMEKDGSLKKWADSTGKGLGDLVATIGSADWQKIGGDIVTVASAIRDLASAIQTAASWIPSMDALGSIEVSPYGGLKYRPPGYKPPAARAPYVNPVPMMGAVPRATPKPDWQRALRNGPTRAAPAKAQVSVHITTDPGVKASTRKVAASGVDMDVNTGRAMRGFA